MKNNQHISARRILKGVGLCIFLLISIPTIAYYSLISFKDLINTQKNEKVLGVKNQQERIDEVKNSLLKLIPEEYEVVESEYVEPSVENDGCVFIFSIYPKEYSEVEKEYLQNAEIMYCKDINTAVLRGQIEEVKYSSTEGRWLFESESPLETKQYRDNIVSMVGLGGSHALSIFHIVRIGNSDELVILSIPESNRIRCDTFQNGVEVMKEDCVAFRDSLNTSPELYEWVPSEVYDNYYSDLLGILKEI